MRRGAFDFYTAEYAADQSVPPGTLADKGLMKRRKPLNTLFVRNDGKRKIFLSNSPALDERR